MTDKEIKFKVINELKGTESMSKQQVDSFIDYMFFILLIEENAENKNTIIEGIKMYFKLATTCYFAALNEINNYDRNKTE